MADISYEDIEEEGRRRVKLLYSHRYFRLSSDRVDLVDQVMVRAWRGLSRGLFQGEREGIWPWLLTIAANEYATYTGRQLRHQIALSLDSFTNRDVQFASVADQAGILDTLDTGADFWGDVETSMLLRDEIIPAIMQLKPSWRRALLGHALGYTDAELAAGESYSTGNIRILRFRALNRLRKILGAKTPPVDEGAPSPETKRESGNSMLTQNNRAVKRAT